MPNFQIPQSIRHEIIAGATTYLDRVETYALARFPIPLDQLQLSLLDSPIVATLADLRAQGVQSISQYRDPEVLFTRQKLPGLSRHVAFNLMLPRSIFLKNNTYGLNYSSMRLPSASEAIPFDVSVLSEEGANNLTTWANHALRQHRLVRLAKVTVGEVMANHTNYTKTTAHLRALWPALAGLVSDRGWVGKFNVETRALKSYQPDPEVVAKFTKRMQVTDMLIEQGKMLQPYVHQSSAIRALVAWWECQDGDVRY